MTFSCNAAFTRLYREMTINHTDNSFLLSGSSDKSASQVLADKLRLLVRKPQIALVLTALSPRNE